MRRVFFTVCLALVATAAFAEGPVVNSLAFHNVHLRVPDPPKAAEWYVKYAGATAGRAPQLVFFGKTLIEFVKDASAQPSVGSVIDHIGLSYPDLDAKMKEFAAGGAKVLSQVRDVPGLFKVGFVEDLWGTKIEVVEDAEQLGFHHVHLRVPDPAATLAWYQNMLGGQRGQLKGKIDGLNYGGVWLLAASSGSEKTAPSAGRAIWNVAWLVPNVDEAVAA